MHIPESMDVRELLARVLWGEDRGEGRAGMQAVACVVMNRANNPRWWGRDLRGVLLRPKQFSCLLAGDPNRKALLAVTAADPAFRVALQVADAAMARRLRDVTNGADHYLVTSWARRTEWAAGKVPVAIIGNHSFYRLELPAPAEARAVPGGVA